MEIFIERENKTVNLEIDGEQTIKRILKKLNLSTESVIIIKNNDISLEDELVSNTDKLKLLSVVSGG